MPAPARISRPRTTLDVVTSWPTWRWVCSAAWKSSPSTVEGSRARPTSRGSSRVAGSVARSWASARVDGRVEVGDERFLDADALLGAALRGERSLLRGESCSPRA